MKWIVLTVLLALSVNTATAKEELDFRVTRSVLHAYDTRMNESARIALEMLVEGMQEGIMWANIELTAVTRLGHARPSELCRSLRPLDGGVAPFPEIGRPLPATSNCPAHKTEAVADAIVFKPTA